MDLSTKTIEELKSLAYDQIAQKEMAERNLAILNQEISKRLQATQVTPMSVPEGEPEKEEA